MKLARDALALVLLVAAQGAEAQIRVAVVGPMTGAYAAFGQQMRIGAEQAVADLNAAGGVLGEEIELLVGDDACDPKQAVAVANQMVGEGVVLVIGHFCSGSSIPASDVYFEEEIVMISPGSTNPQLTEAGKWNVFRVCGRDDQQGEVAAKFLASEFPEARIALAHDKQTYSLGLTEQTKLFLNGAGIEEVFYETVNPGERDYSAFITRLKQAEPDILYYGGYHTEAGLLVRQMRDQGMETILMSGDALVTDEFWSITGAAGEGTLMTFSPDPARDPANAAIVAAIEQTTGRRPEGYTLYSYGAVQAWAQAAEALGATEPWEVGTSLREGRFDTVLGPVDFDEKGDVTGPGYVVYEWREGAYDYR